MNKEILKQPYGYMPPNLGGEGMGPKRENYLVLNPDERWKPVCMCVSCGNHYEPGTFYTRPISPGDVTLEKGDK